MEKWLNWSTPLINHPLEGDEVGSDSKAHAVVFEESFKLQAALITSESKQPQGRERARLEVWSLQ